MMNEEKEDTTALSFYENVRRLLNVGTSTEEDVDEGLKKIIEQLGTEVDNLFVTEFTHQTKCTSCNEIVNLQQELQDKQGILTLDLHAVADFSIEKELNKIVCETYSRHNDNITHCRCVACLNRCQKCNETLKIECNIKSAPTILAVNCMAYTDKMVRKRTPKAKSNPKSKSQKDVASNVGAQSEAEGTF